MACAGVQSALDREMFSDMVSRYGKWECQQCRMGKATCVCCKGEGFVNSEPDGLIRCKKEGCGRAFPRKDSLTRHERLHSADHVLAEGTEVTSWKQDARHTFVRERGRQSTVKSLAG